MQHGKGTRYTVCTPLAKKESENFKVARRVGSIEGGLENVPITLDAWTRSRNGKREKKIKVELGDALRH
jgi:hypothetical protein